MLASWVLPGWMSDTQELKETLEWLLSFSALFCFSSLFYFGTGEKRLVGGGGGVWRSERRGRGGQ